MAASLGGIVSVQGGQAKADTIIEVAKEMLPPAPPVAFKLLSMLRNSGSQQNHEVVDVIRYDPDLTAQLLKLCNTGTTKGVAPIVNLDQAVLRLGYSNILEKVLSISFGGIYQRKRSGYGLDPYRLWRHSIASAISAKYLARFCHLGGVDGDLAFTTALLHDIGKAVLNMSDHPELPKIKPLMLREGLSYSEAEQKVLGTDHAEVGGRLLQKWGLPKNIVDAVLYHNTPELDKTGFAGMMFVASHCAVAVSTGWSWKEFQDCVKMDVPAGLGIDEDSISSGLESIGKESGAIEAYMMVA